MEKIYNYFKDKFDYLTDIYYCEPIILLRYTHDKHIINFEIWNYNEIYAVCENTQECYNDDLAKILEKCDDLDLQQYQIPAYIIDEFISHKFDASGFNDTEVDISIKKDYLYVDLRKIINNVMREIIIVSFGERFQKPQLLELGKISIAMPFNCHKTFDVRHMNSAKPHNGGLHDLRGTDEIIQKCIESANKYDIVMKWIVEYIENNNCKVIGIYCRSGHHRSVAVTELLKKHVYPNATIKHLHINRK